MIARFFKLFWRYRRYFPLLIIIYFIVATVLGYFKIFAPLAVGIFLVMTFLMGFSFVWQIVVISQTELDWSKIPGGKFVSIALMYVLFLAAVGMLYGAFFSFGLFLDLVDIENFNAFNKYEDAIFGTTVGSLGVIVGIVSLWRVTVWRLHHIRQLAILPSSKARSAAVGLVELQGRARPVKEGEPHIPFDRNAGFRFYLEDETGHILVDASKCVLRSTFWWVFFSQRVPEIVLHARNENVTDEPGLSDGDPVYVLGWANILDKPPSYASGSDRLVIKKRPVDEKFDFPDVFFITDKPEENARQILWQGLVSNAVLSLLWIGFSSVCLWAGIIELR